MTFREALKRLHKVGTAHATGDSLRAMYADLIAFQHNGGDTRWRYKQAEKFYAWLADKGDDGEVADAARVLLRDRQKAWDIQMGIEVTL